MYELWECYGLLEAEGTFSQEADGSYRKGRLAQRQMDLGILFMNLLGLSK